MDAIFLWDICDKIIQHIFPFVRILAFFSSAPVFYEKGVNKKIKIALAFIITFLISPTLVETSIDVFSCMGVLIIGSQFLIGISMGLTAQFIFVTIKHAGEVIGLQMGLSFATFYDPVGGQNLSVISRILNLLVTMLFLTYNGHLFMIGIIANSFQMLPIMERLPDISGYIAIIRLAGNVFKCGLMVGMPVIAVLLCLNISLGFLNRLIPQLSVFVIGFPVSLTTGIISLSLVMLSLPLFFEKLMSSIFDDMVNILTFFSSKN
ncbi:TPA: flagellar biosynthetic protein FliR [Salmonella enterica]|uniref:Flagellar biosynthetic protein FliR n=1 Tax=Salmonella enterica TaxID=28901 RepID=A0A757C667_SALER|nr:flagellar biosynthetic protein FliR [Salmonella enterica subsp. enterica serovar Richmond]HAG0390718.1 flagellar biosynthetic protein FliR [Salmonella enterica]